MRKAKIIAATVTAVVALDAVASTMATAALPEFLPASGRFTSTSGNGTLQIAEGTSIECLSDNATGEITGAKTANVVFDIHRCEIAGVAARSLGDPEGVILMAAKGELCYLNKVTREVGLKLTLTGKVHIEGPPVGLTILEGTMIGRLTPVNQVRKAGDELILQQTGGNQAITKCEGGPTEHLSGSEDEGTVKAAAFATDDKISFENNTEILA